MKRNGTFIGRLASVTPVRCKLMLFVVVIASPLACAQTAHVVPTAYEAGHFYATPQTAGGLTLKLLVDTGGGGGSGMYWITARAAKRLSLKVRNCKLGKDTIKVANVPAFKIGRGLPPPLNSPCGKSVMVQSGPYQGADGQLGAGYLPGRVWTFDYPAHQLLVRAPSRKPGTSVHAAELGFPINASGGLADGFARITIDVAGRPVEMLLDTGATAHPTPAGDKASHTPTVRGYGVTSYIDQSVFVRWHKEHPDWHVVPNGDSVYGPKIIEVPKVLVAGWSVGPVWFTVQLHIAAYMSQFTDRPIKGALGGNVFRHFIMTVDYPHRVAYFQCATGCKLATSQPSVR